MNSHIALPKRNLAASKRVLLALELAALSQAGFSAGSQTTATANDGSKLAGYGGATSQQWKFTSY